VVKLFSGSSFVYFSSILLLILVTFWGHASGVTLPEAPYENSLIGDIRIDVKDFYGNEKEWIDMVQSIASTYIRKGDRFSRFEVTRLATALKDCRQFRLIHLDTEMAETGLALLITVTPFRLIKNIRTRGTYPLFEKQIRNVMTIYPGGTFVPEEVDRQSLLVADLYRQYGYIDPKVRIESVQDPEDSHFFLDVLIEKGRLYRLSQFEMTGNTAFQASELRWKMKSVRKTRNRFSEKLFFEDLKRLIGFYRAQGFSDIVIEHQLEKKPETGEVEIRLTVDEGDRYTVSFVGNTAFGNSALKKELTLFKSGNRRGTGLRKSIRNINEKYRQAGWTEAAVIVETQVAMEENISVKKLRFIIDEGLRSIVRKIVISGNTVFRDEKLIEQMLTRPPGWMHDGEYVAERLDEDILAIKNLYHGVGYLEVDPQKTVNFSSDRSDIVIDLNIHEGRQTQVSRVDLEGLTAVPEAMVIKDIRIQAGKPFVRSKVNQDEKQIAMMVSEKGYPYVQVSGDVTFNEDRTSADVVYRVRQNRYVERGNTFYSGNFRTKEKILERELIMKPGDPFSLKKMTEGQQSMRAMNIFRSVAFHPVGLKEEAETIHLLTEVEEEKPFYFEVTGGYASETGLYTTSTIGDRNFLGSNKDAKVSGEISRTGYKGESRLFEPRFLGTRISSDLGVFFERSEPFNQTFGTDSLGTDLHFSRKWKKQIKLGLGFNYERREQFSREHDADTDDAFDPRSILVVIPSIRFDSRDNFLNPKKGIFWLFEVDVSRGIENSLDDFYKSGSDLRGYITPIDRLTLAGRGSVGKITRYGSKGKIADDQLFFLGGTTSVRGFDESLLLTDNDNDPVGGKLMFLGNAEARIDLGSNFEVSCFYDIGYLNKTSGSERSDNVRYSAGIGFRYVTPVGAVGLVYAHKLNPEPYESAGEFHFSIGYTF
jgi:outer membrane protein insertion porin family